MRRFLSVCLVLFLAVLSDRPSGAEPPIPNTSGSGGPVHIKAAPELCAEVDAELNLRIHCAQYLDQRYDFSLHHFINELSPLNFFWNLDPESIISADCDCQSECPTVSEVNLNISFPCFIYNNTQYDLPITLLRFTHPLDPMGLYWRLVLSPPTISMTLFPMTDDDCPGRGSGTVSTSGDKDPGEVAVGKRDGLPVTRGYIEFEGYDNAFNQIQNLKVDSAFLRIYVTDPAGEGSDVRVVSLQDLVNPEGNIHQYLCSFSLTGRTIWDKITAGQALSQGTTGVIGPGWFDLPLDPAAVEVMLKRTNQNFIGLGLLEAGDDGDGPVFEGWNSNPLFLPQLVIDYHQDTSSPDRPDDPSPGR
jgi:hypothetical protein